ncbi:MAG: methyltransferase domain-containing protein [Thermoplasmata archaeon]|nr:MAG: methyltransferase domain-containing protein [Thermoplasmata archaeon]
MMKKSTKSISANRFDEAQEAEQNYWRRREEEIISDKFRRQKRHEALTILNELREVTGNGHLKNVLEIGGAGDPILEYYYAGHGVVLDPLAKFFKTELFPMQLKSVEYYCGIGEHLPFKSNSFDGVLLYNCIDHGLAPFDILSESKRVLRRGGALHLLVDTYSLISNTYRMMVEQVLPMRRVDEHPHGLRFNVIEKYLKDIGFVEVISGHDEHPYSQNLNKPPVSTKRFIKDMVRCHRKLRAFYRLEDMN